MDHSTHQPLLQEINASLDRLLLRDRAQLNRLIRQLQPRTQARQPTDPIIKKLQRTYAQAQERIQRRERTQPTLIYPNELPVSTRRHDICDLIKKHPVVIVCGTTGSGKTTQLPKIALEAGLGKTGRIGITQPRRLAATGMAQRVAKEMKTDGSKGAGYQVRFDNQTNDETIVKFMTDGILLAETRNDRRLLQYDGLIIDEAHERSLNIDFILGYLKTLLPLRPDLKIIISSATLDAAAFSEFFHHAPVIEVEGRTYPVADYFLPPGKDEELSNHILRAVRHISEIDDRGDILVFLPGEREIRDAADKLEGQSWKSTEVFPLFGRLSMGEQQRVFKPGDQRRIILATNVAETSLTIPGIHYVVDSGLVRLSRYNPHTQIQELQIEQVSQASARQRRGRCGRIADGVCIHLYEEATLDGSAVYTDPEIRRTALAGIILQMDLLGLPPIDDFPLIDPPQKALVKEGYRTLQDLGALDERRKLTPIGRQIAQFPVDPHLARMLVQAGDEGALPELLILVAFLSIQDVRERPTEKIDEAERAHAQWQDPRSDFITILNLWNAVESQRGQGGSHGKLRRYCKLNFLNYRRVMEWTNLWRELRETAQELRWIQPLASVPKNDTHKKMATSDAIVLYDSSYDLIHRSLLAGLPANIGLKSESPEFNGSRGRKFFIFPGSVLFKKPPQWVMTFALVETTRCYARTVAEIQPEWLESIAPHLCKSVYKNPAWNAHQGFVYAVESVVSGGLTLLDGRRIHYGPVNPPHARELFIREGMVTGNLTTHAGWHKIHQRMLDDITALEEKIRRPNALLDPAAIFQHFDRLLPADVYSVKSLEKWLQHSKARIAMQLTDAMYPQTRPVNPQSYPDELDFGDEPFPLLYTYEPGAELDGIALVCRTDRFAHVPRWAPDWLVPGWLEEKTERLLRTLPKNLRSSMASINTVAQRFIQADIPQDRPLLDALTNWLQKEFKLPVDESDFDESALPAFLQMKVIETDGDRIIRVHTSISKDKYLHARLRGAEAVFAKWNLPPQKTWPGAALPEFITADDPKATRGYPALCAEAGGVGRRVFLSEANAAASHRAGLARLFRLQQSELVQYVEKRPPMSPTAQLTMSALDNAFLPDFIDLAILEALTADSTLSIRDANTFALRATEARMTLHETAANQAGELSSLLDSREKIKEAIDASPGDFDSLHDLTLQLGFLFRPGFMQTPRIFQHYPRYLKAMQLRLQRIRTNPQADLRKLAEIEPFQNRLNEKLLQSDDITAAHDLLGFALLLEEFRLNRFAPEIKTPFKISAKRLEEAWIQLP